MLWEEVGSQPLGYVLREANSRRENRAGDNWVAVKELKFIYHDGYI